MRKKNTLSYEALTAVLVVSITILVILYFIVMGALSMNDPVESVSPGYGFDIYVGYLFLLTVHIAWLFPVKFIIKQWKNITNKQRAKRILFLLLFPYISGYMIIIDFLGKRLKALDFWEWHLE